MNRTRTARPVLALALALTGGLLVAPSSAEPLPPELDPVVCALPADALSALLMRETAVDTDVSGDVSWDLTGTPRGNGGGVGIGNAYGTTKDVVGTLETAWQVEGTRCAGLTYRLTVTGSSRLMWTTTAASSTAPSGGASVPGTTTTSADGTSVSVAFVADRDTDAFLVRGTTAGYAPEDGCVEVALSVSAPDGTVQYLSEAELCDGVAGGMSYR